MADASTTWSPDTAFAPNFGFPLPTSAPSTPPPAPTGVNWGNLPTMPSGRAAPVSFSQLATGASLSDPTSTPVATGFPLFQSMMNLILQASAEKRANIDQQISLQRLLVDLGRTSPTRAADLAVNLGLPDQSPDLSWINAFAGGAHPASTTGGFFGGQAGNQNIALPAALSGQQLSFLANNPNVASIVQDAADKFGMPDLFKRSQAGLVPTTNSIYSGAF